MINGSGEKTRMDGEEKKTHTANILQSIDRKIFVIWCRLYDKLTVV